MKQEERLDLGRIVKALRSPPGLLILGLNVAVFCGVFGSTEVVCAVPLVLAADAFLVWAVCYSRDDQIV